MDNMNKTKGQLKNEAKELSMAIKLEKAPLHMVFKFANGKRDFSDENVKNITLEPKDGEQYRADLVKEDKKFRIKQIAEKKKLKKLNINSHKGGTKSNDKSKKSQ